MAHTAKNPSLLTQVAVDVVLFSVVDGKLCVLLIKRSWAPYEGIDALPGAFLRAGETTVQTAQRVLHEKAGIPKPVYIEQLYTFDASGRDPRGQFPSVAYMTLVPSDLPLAQAESSQQPHWTPLDHLGSLAFDHSGIIRYGLSRLRAKLEYTNVIYSLLPRRFTLTHLQDVYEQVMGKNLDKRNFRKKYLSLKLIRPTRSMERGGQRRPARLYEFVSRKPAELKKFF
jgi:8-oxo-dGTP diphosphatase